MFALIFKSSSMVNHDGEFGSYLHDSKLPTFQNREVQQEVSQHTDTGIKYIHHIM